MRRWPIWILLAAGLALRLLIAPRGGHPYDLVVIGEWAGIVARGGYLNTYVNTPANYGPLMLALMGLSGWLYGLLGGTSFAPVGLWPVIFKLPSILCDLGIGWVVYWLSLPDEDIPLHWKDYLPAVLVIFHPALILLSAWWGQYEQPYLLPSLLAAALLARSPDRTGNLLTSGAALGLGLMVKPQAAAALPALLLLAIHSGWRVGSWISAARSGLLWAGGMAAACLILLAPFLLAGQGGLVWARITAPMVGPGWLTLNAFNLWFLATGGAGNWAYGAPLIFSDRQVILGGLSARGGGVILLAVWTAIVLALAWRAAVLHQRAADHRRNAGVAGWMLACALLHLGMFLFLTQVHERYAIGAVVFGAGYAATRTSGGWRRWLFFAMIGVLHSANLLWSVPYLYGGRALPLWVGIAGSVGMALTEGVGLAQLAHKPRFPVQSTADA